MSIAENKIDTKLVTDTILVLMLIFSIVVYMESSSELQELLTALKYNSLEALNNGLTVLESNGK